MLHNIKDFMDRNIVWFAAFLGLLTFSSSFASMTPRTQICVGSLAGISLYLMTQETDVKFSQAVDLDKMPYKTLNKCPFCQMNNRDELSVGVFCRKGKIKFTWCRGTAFLCRRRYPHFHVRCQECDAQWVALTACNDVVEENN